MRTMASRLLRMVGSGTLRTSTVLRPVQTVARIASGSRGLRGALPQLLRRACTPRADFGAHHLAGLQHLLEAAQVVVELLQRLLAEELGDRQAGPARRRRVLELDHDLG